MENPRDKRKGWLKELKPGDKVAVYYLPIHATSYGREEEIEKIRIVCNRFNSKVKIYNTND